jgi:HEAT repeats
MPGKTRQSFSHELIGVACVSLLGIIFMGTAGFRGDSPLQGQPKMDVSTLDKQIRENDGSARDTARRIGAAALPTVMPHVRSTSADERVIALECIAAIGADSAPAVLVEALKDPEIDVRSTALRELLGMPVRNLNPQLAALLTGSQDALVRGGVATLLRRAGAREALKILIEQRDRETDEDTRQRMTNAAAGLGDKASREQILGRLADPVPRVRYTAIADLEDSGDATQLPHLVPLLQDDARVKNVGIEQWPVWHRVCDRAVEAIVALSGRTAPFPVGARNYTSAEIQEAKSIASRQP